MQPTADAPAPTAPAPTDAGGTTRRLAWVLFAVLLVGVFWHVLFLPRQFGFRDVWTFHEPLFRYEWMEWAAGRMPGWNPYDDCGQPLVANPAAAVFYPLQLVFALPLPYELAFKAFVLLHFLVGAAGARWLVRRRGLSETAAAITMLSYVFGGGILFQYCNPTFLAGAAWLPWAIGFGERLLTRPTVGGAVGLAAVTATIVLAGDPQMAYYVGLVLGIGWLVGVGSGNQDDAESPDGHTQRRWRTLPWLVGSAVLAGGLSAVQVLPTLSMTPDSLRSASPVPTNVWQIPGFLLRGSGDYDRVDTNRPPNWYDTLVGNPPPPAKHYQQTYSFSLHPVRLLEGLWPNFGGVSLPGAPRWTTAVGLERRVWMPSVYFGLLPFLLALSAVRLWGGSDRVRWASWVLLLFVLGSFGKYGLAWLLTAGQASSPELGGVYWVMNVLLPVHASFRYPAKLWTVAALFASLLAGRGWEDGVANRTWFRRTLAGIAAASAVGLLVAGIVALVPPSGRSSPMLHATLASFGWCFGQTLVVAGIVILLLRWSVAPSSRASAILALLVVDLLVANAWSVVSAPYPPDPPLFVRLLDEAGPADGAIETVAPTRVQITENWRPLRDDPFAGDAPAADPTEWALNDYDGLMGLHHLPWRVARTRSLGTTLRDNVFAAYFDMLPFLDVGLLIQPRRAFDAWGTEYFLMLDIPENARVYGRLQIDFSTVGLRRRWSEPRWDPANPTRSAVPHGKPLPWAVPRDAETYDGYRGIAFLRNDDAFPRAWVVRQLEDRPVIDRAERPDWLPILTSSVFPIDGFRDLRSLAVVEDPSLAAGTPPRSRTLGSGEPDLGACRIVHYDPSRVEIEAELDSAGLVVFSDAHHPDWRLEVASDGGEPAPAEMRRVNVAMRGVELPAGSHRLVFQYRPTSVYVGGTISIIAWLTAGVALVVIRVRRRTKATGEAGLEQPTPA